MQSYADHSRDVALHEARHASYAAYRGLQVLGIFVGASEGSTDVCLPVAPSHVQEGWDASPRLALHHIHSIVGALIAPVASEDKLFRGPTDDSAELARYAAAWTRLRPSRATGQHAPAWLDMLADVRNDVRRWATAPGALVATYELAHWLQREGEVDASGWAWLWGQRFCAPLHQSRNAPAAQRPQPAGAARPKITGLDIQYQWLLEDAEHLQRSMSYAQSQKPSGRYGRHLLVA
jgi:hypothetical protein